MKGGANWLPEALTKGIISRIGIGGILLTVSIFVSVLWRDVYLTVPCLLFSVYFLLNGIQLYRITAGNKFGIVTGRCSFIERTKFRRKISSITFITEAEKLTIKLLIKHQIQNLQEGDWVTVYISRQTPVYDNGESKVLCSYLAIQTGKEEK